MHQPRHLAQVSLRSHNWNADLRIAAREESAMYELMELKLSSVEVQLIAQLLRSDKSRLDDEINHTDRREFREFLKERETILDGVLTKLHS
jgi:hypothetical protein